MKRFTTWSYSQVSTWQQCPHRAKLSYLDKIRMPPAPAMERGSAIHKEAELFVSQQQHMVPPSLGLLADGMRKLQAIKPSVELVWGLDRNWNPCDPHGKDRWLKVILDIHFGDKKSTTVIDYKTGKVRPDNHQKQMGLYALASFLHTGTKQVNTELWYVDHGKVVKDTYTRDEIGPMKEAWTQVVTMMEHDTIFPKKPNPLCNWCPFHGTPHCEF